ncbi:uroporphyrinogen-III synthase [Rhizobium sp. RU20A]|uniref:uroporphyrinogen-III synthase n=1 Tax=Rhizobium sp. RU20A TaxID=1907412 RepID=UPI000953C871|nr:uroporphyrinogen-III synthase [Rhizobium sp. RU20A]SIQ90210.1 uroporphyrinogen-III synthase [Rhizobium sp. RU20A]
MRVLVTRPEPAATRTAEKLVALGHVPILLPLSRARHDPQAALRALNGSSARRGASQAGGQPSSPPCVIAVTSAEALRALESLGEALVPHLSRPLFAVGQATAAMAKSLGFRDIVTGEGNGADLAAAIARAPQASAGVIYLAGRPRARGLEDALCAAGIPLSVAVCYTMQPLDYERAAVEARLSSSVPQAVLVYSGETARALITLLQGDILSDLSRQMTWHPLSPAIAGVLPATLSVAEPPARPDEDLLLATLA